MQSSSANILSKPDRIDKVKHKMEYLFKDNNGIYHIVLSLFCDWLFFSDAFNVSK